VALVCVIDPSLCASRGEFTAAEPFRQRLPNKSVTAAGLPARASKAAKDQERVVYAGRVMLIDSNDHILDIFELN